MIVEETISWILTSKPTPAEPHLAIRGYWENTHGQVITPRSGMIIDPTICDRHWEAALETLGYTTMKIPGDSSLYVTSLKSKGNAPIKIRGYK